MINPDIWQDEKIATLDFAGRLFFIGLITHANDYGKLRGNPKLLKSLIFPYDDNSLLIQEYLNNLDKLKVITLYEINNEKFIKINNWTKHQTLTYKGKDDIPEPILNQSLINPEPTLITNTSKDKLSKDNIKQPSAGKKQPVSVNNLLITELRNVFKSGLNIYALIERMKKQLGWSKDRQFPDEVLLKVCHSYEQGKDKIENDWAWFCAAIKKASEEYFAEQNIKQGQEWKQQGVAQSIKDILGSINLKTKGGE